MCVFVNCGRDTRNFIRVTRVVAHVQCHELQSELDRLLVPLFVVAYLHVGLFRADELAVENGRTPAALAAIPIPHKARALGCLAALQALQALVLQLVDLRKISVIWADNSCHIILRRRWPLCICLG